MTYCFVDKCVTCIGAVKGLVAAASTTTMHSYTAGDVELAGGFWVFFGNLNTHFSRLARGPLNLL